MDFTIRPAVPSDISSIVELCVEQYGSAAVKNDTDVVKRLTKDGFGDPRLFKCLIAEDSCHTCVGFILYYYIYSTWEGRSIFIEDIVVSVSLGRDVIGKELLRQAIKAGIDEKCSRCDFLMHEQNGPSCKFYESSGAINLSKLEGWNLFSLPKLQLESLVQCNDQSSQTFIREACPTDCQKILTLIQELADYEKMPEGPKIDAKVLDEDCFGQHRYFHCFVAEAPEGKLVGYVIYFFAYSLKEGRSVYMEDLYVTPSYRKCGLGIGLWKRVVQDGLEKGCSKCNFSVLNWNLPSIEFYKSKGARNVAEEEGVDLWRLTKEAMEAFLQYPQAAGSS